MSALDENRLYRNVAAFSESHRELFQQTLPTNTDAPLYNHFKAEASAQGMSGVDVLRYMIAKQRATFN